MESLKKVNWDIDGNEFLSVVNNFGLCISMGVINSNLNEDDDELLNGAKDIGFVLTVFNLEDKTKTYCTFTLLEDVMFFVNKYIRICDNIADVNKQYNSFCISNEVISSKGYKS